MRIRSLSILIIKNMEQEHKLQHIGIIMDGNRRWAVDHHLPKMLGHTEGAKNLKRIAKFILNQNIPYLTLYTLSTENLKRSEEELKHLFSLFEKLTDYIKDLLKNDTRLNIIGDLTRLPIKTQKKLKGVMEKTKNNSALILTLAIAYGGRDEIVRAVKKITSQNLPPEKITEEYFESCLDTTGLPEVDLVIRTGGNQRLSNFLPWQTTYAELYFTNTYWPAFYEEELKNIIDWFFEQKRNKGK